MIVVAGEALIDLVPQGAGALVSQRPARGGGPYNTAVALGPLGARTPFCPRVSYDAFGAALLGGLHAAGVDVSSVQRGTEPTTLAVASLDADGSADGNEIVSYVSALVSGADFAKGSRFANGGGTDDWNREHVWAKSHGDFGTATGPGTDIHHLRPEDVAVNSVRGNKDLDNGGSPVGEAPENTADSDSFEPRDAVKGDVARMIFY
ncbi:PfkB family carbohydrate kinase, partial [Streptomyces sp. WAC08241]|uniref:PfkB family carbohydrate kinase n=1 Tax=Streptomyces sp. WAC08241 TaxID=2487421 RepID=UPI00163C8B4B